MGEVIHTLYILLRDESCMIEVKRILVILLVLSCCPFTKTCQSTGSVRADHEASLFENAKPSENITLRLTPGGGGGSGDSHMGYIDVCRGIG